MFILNNVSKPMVIFVNMFFLCVILPSDLNQYSPELTLVYSIHFLKQLGILLILASNWFLFLLS